MATSRDRYYIEIFKTLTDYNDRNNTPLFNDNILEPVRKVMEEESVSDSNKVTTGIFSHTSNIQRENAKLIFTSEKLDKSDDLEGALKDSTINDAKYYESDTATSIDAQGYPTRNPETVTYTINSNEKVTNTSNGTFEQKILSNRTIPGAVLKINPIIGQRLAPIVVVPQTLLTSATKEFVADAGSGVAWVSRTPRRVISTDVDGSTPGGICKCC